MAFKQLFAFSSLAASLSVSYAALTRRVSCPDGVNTATNAACCQWFTIRDDLQNNLFDNTCGEEVREAVRLTFHDGIGFSPTNGGGGSDGSIITFASTELTFANNNDGGVEDIVTNLTPFVSKYNITPGDLIYFASAVGISNCPGAPKLTFLAGRPDPTGPAPDGTVSSPTDTVDAILTRFGEVGFSSDEVVALLASHSIGAADGITGSFRGAPFDSSAHVFDSQFYVETLLDTTLAGEVRLPSDGALARDNRTSCTWQGFITDQDGMRSAFAAAMLKLSVVQQDQSSLVDCSEVIPDVIANNAAPYLPGTVTSIDQSCTATPFPTLVASAALISVTAVNEF